VIAREAIALEALCVKRLLTEKPKIFSKAAILLWGVAGGLGGSHVALGDLGDHKLPRGSHVTSGGLGWSGVALGTTDGLLGSQMASRAAGGLVGTWVAMGSCGWPLEVAVDLGGVTNYMSKLYKCPKL
jgi:hypothetical protein